MKLANAEWWYKEIKQRSKRRLDILPYITFAVVTAGIFASAYIITFLSEGGKIGPIEVPKDIVKYLLFLINSVNGGVGIINAIGILKFRQQAFLRYHRVALGIVEQAYQNGLIDNSKKEQMFDAIALHLTPCDDPANRKRCEEELRRLSVKLADIVVK